MRATADPVRDIARAVLYEGYVLWPYRRDTVKNRRRWTFGGVLPGAWTEAGHGDDRCALRAETLVRTEPGSSGSVEVAVRWLHIVERRVARVDGDRLTFVDALDVNGERHVSWDEATEREVIAPRVELVEDGARTCCRIGIPAGSATEPLGEAGVLVRSWRALEGRVEVRVERLRADLWRVSAVLVNETPWRGTDREDALRSSCNSSHFVLRAYAAAFVSLTDPEADVADAAAACDNVGCWPVLAGPRGSRDTMLAAPIILSDWPAIAPESPGDLFDGGEIDELLVLNILGLTDEEKSAMREADARTREILERTESLTAAQMMRLHGTFRDVT